MSAWAIFGCSFLDDASLPARLDFKTIVNLRLYFLQHDVHRKPQGLIILDEKCQVSRADGANTFEIATESKTYYLTADSQPLMEDWVRVLQNVVQRNALKLLLSREDGVAPTLQVCTLFNVVVPD